MTFLALAGCDSVSVGTASRAATTATAAAPASAACSGVTGGQVVLYSVKGLEYWYADVLTNFEADCGVQVYYVAAAGIQLVDRLTSERAAPLADVAVMQAPDIEAAARPGLLAGTDVPGADAVPADRCDTGRRWCTVAEDYTSWIYNSSSVGSPPAHYSDLLGGSYQGRVAYSRPDSTPDGLAMVQLLAQTQGTEAAFGYLARLEAGTSAHFLNIDTMSRVVSTGGSAVVANGNLQEHLNDLLQYHNLSIWFPATDAGTPPVALALPYGGALVKDGRNPANARALLAYLWSAAAQMQTSNAYLSSARPDVRPTDGRAVQISRALQGVQILRPDWTAVGAARQTLIDRWLALRTAPDSAAPVAATPPPPTQPPPPPTP